MAKVCGLYVGILTALALCKYCLVEANGTESANGTVTDCHRHGDNCTDSTDSGPGSGHFSKCPEELKHYCIHGECRYVEQQKTPSCICQHGYHGSRCEYVDLGWQIGDKREVVIICTVVGLILLILFIVCVCLYDRRRWRWCWHRKRRREEPRNGTEKLGMLEAGATGAALTPDSRETPHADAV